MTVLYSKRFWGGCHAQPPTACVALPAIDRPHPCVPPFLAAGLPLVFRLYGSAIPRTLPAALVSCGFVLGLYFGDRDNILAAEMQP